MKRILTVLLSICGSILIHAQSQIDVLYYYYKIELNDANDTIKGLAGIGFRANEKTSGILIDLAGLNKEKKGMIVTGVTFNDPHYMLIDYKQESDKIIIRTQPIFQGDTTAVFIHYEGVPADGLIISRNKYGKRTFFSDNWPDRAHHWIPCVDDPSDKASVEFIITAPSHYKVVSNGVLQEEKELPGNKKRTHWKEDVPLPTKIMVIGVADFAVDTAGYVHDIPVTSWVFPENKKAGFYDYSLAKDVLAWFVDYIGPFPYKKLANVQSKTIFGGMENAGAIFYNESTVTGTRSEERLLAHEITHQWFGDMVTEKNFSHLWLSEGFATYLANLYLESKYGMDRFNKETKEDRDQVIGFARTSKQPVADTVSPYMQLLNANSYQKGGWILHMLRRQLGDAVFQAIIRTYYASYAGKNTDSRDFQRICEQVSGKSLGTFFHQWLFIPGIPKLDIEWKYNVKKRTVLLTIDQLQNNLFDFPLEIAIETATGVKRQGLHISRQSQEFSIPVRSRPIRLTADPDISILFEGTVSKTR